MRILNQQRPENTHSLATISTCGRGKQGNHCDPEGTKCPFKDTQECRARLQEKMHTWKH